MCNRTLVSFDWALKNILRDKANFDVLEGLLTALLQQEIKVISLLESEGNQQSESDKFNRIDIVVEDENKQIMAIEIQNNRETHYLERLLYGTSKIIVDHVKIGERYEKVRKVISISILYFLLGEGEDDYIYHGKTEFYGLHTRKKLELHHRKQDAITGKIITEKKNIFPEYYLIEVERFQDIISNDIDEWIYFLKNSEIKPNFKAKNIQQAKEKLDLLKMEPEKRKAYEKFLMDRASEKDVIDTARVEGKEEGKEEGKIEVAKNMLAEKIDISLIAKVTGLSEDEIRKL